MFELYYADCTGRAKNCRYPHHITVTDATTLKQAVSWDYVCAEYKDDYRSRANFVRSNCLALDFDNDHSEDPQKWVKPEDVLNAFPEVTIGIHYSRNHLKSKNGKTPRPKFHALLETETVTDPKAYSRMKKRLAAFFPQCDPNALDAARFFFGTLDANVTFRPGTQKLDEVLQETNVPAEAEQSTGDEQIIQEGTRNATLSLFAAKLVKRMGWNDNSYASFRKEADKCEPPLPEEELKSIWQSAGRFAEVVQSQEGYIPPDRYGPGARLKPPDYSDMGEAMVIAKDCADELIYASGFEFLAYNGRFWDESSQKAVGLVQKFMNRQLLDAEAEYKAAEEHLESTGITLQKIRSGGKKVLENLTSEQDEAFDRLAAADTYKKFVMKYRNMKNLEAAMQALKPMVEKEPSQLDKEENLLNCPDGTYDLRKGMMGRKGHRPTDLITKITPYAPGDQGKELWLDSVNKIFQGDTELIEYVQRIVGLAAIGEVYQEALIIAYGDGSNGKSTFWNSIAGAMGTYAGMIAADTLTVSCKRNVQPELAEAKGKRFLIAAELEEGTRMSTSIVKQLCSTDEIIAAKKYKDPFKFIPSHLLVLYTNHLPKVGAMDAGIWRRLIVIPFGAKMGGGKTGIKNYAKYLLKNAGPAITKWIIEGAQKVISDNYNLTFPECVKTAIRRYHEENDWLTHFLEECCEIEDGAEAKSGELWDTYRAYCSRTGDFTRSTTEFYTALENRGFGRIKRKQGKFVLGISITDSDANFN